MKLDRKEYCSRSCVGKVLNDNIKKDIRLNAIRLKNLKNGGRKRTIFSPFLPLIRNIKNRCKNKKREYYITVKDLRDLWIEQNGKCFYSGLKMNLPENSNGFRGKPLINNIPKIFSALIIPSYEFIDAFVGSVFISCGMSFVIRSLPVILKS